MVTRGNRLLISLVFAGPVVLSGLVGPVHAATVAGADPFAEMRVSRVPVRFPAAFDLKGLDGGIVKSDQLAGKVILLNFWATWCGPCKEEMPSLARLQSKFDPALFQVITITTDMHPRGIKQFLDHLGISLPVLFDESEEVSRSFMVRGLPTTVLLSQDGRAVGRAVGPRAWDSEESDALVRHVLEGMK